MRVGYSPQYIYYELLVLCINVMPFYAFAGFCCAYLIFISENLHNLLSLDFPSLTK